MLRINLKDKIKKVPVIYQFLRKLYRALRYFLSWLIKLIYFPYIESTKETIEINRDSKIIDLPILICSSLSVDEYQQNTYYGISHTLKKYANISLQKKLMATIEHGLYLSDTVWDADLSPSASGIVTFSKYRERIISKYTDKKVFPVGPYIHYANLINSEKLEELKAKLGRTLLFFPAHSTHWIEAQFEHLETIEVLKNLSASFDSILVCFYWKDYKPNIFSLYRKHNFYCTTAGHIFDWNFLSRLKSVISLSDFTASNTIGTHVGYCVYMQKPHWLFEQKITYNCSQNVSLKEINNLRKSVLSKEYQQLTQLFTNHLPTITDEQYSICKFLWGFDEIKTKEELKAILLDLIQK
ncbi:hypothetical protein RHH25_00735 [Thermosynechococcus sp. PP42]|uniref:hypothetical protein n=1 Tax=Thermosynechococcus sp. PP42 TaxID=3074083 RepID=UPI0028583C3A|nr:hypothetical protein [Thermosynechococcus sp. PP42]MDR5637928.1 hypothetical protein [Thermosynechococcus sp. PP42]